MDNGVEKSSVGVIWLKNRGVEKLSVGELSVGN